MPDDLQKLIADVANLKIRVGQMLRVGAVHDVKSGGGEQKLRVRIGTQPDGKPMLSPWLHTGDHRGEAREEFRYKKPDSNGDGAQNVLLIAPNGDFRQAIVVPWAESDKAKRPDHATDDSETYQFSELRIKKTGDTYEVWIGSAKVRMTKTSVTGRVGKTRFMAHEKGAKIKAKTNAIFVDDEGCWSTVPIDIKDDSHIPDDDK